MIRSLLCFFLFCCACRSQFSLTIPSRAANAMTGTAFYKKIIPLPREEREAIALQEIIAGNMPGFLKKFSVIKTAITDSAGNTINAEYYVSTDYLSIGSDADFARIPLTPMTAQKIADTFHCFLPTRKMVNDIYQQAVVKPEPMPLYSYRDSALIMYHHHLIIEGQRKNKPGLIAGIKKDVVITGKIPRDPKPNRVAIYGWHKPDGSPIQPLYTGHVDWYVDYSHGIRLVKRQIKVNGKMMDYIDVLKHPVYRALLCDEEFCDYYRY
jgi:hypothetical protein